MKLFKRRRLFRPTTERLTLLSILAAGGALLLYRLYSLNPGLATPEQQLPSGRVALEQLWSNPVEAPIQLSRFIVAVLAPANGIAASRLPSVLLAIVLVLVSYWLLRTWYGYRLALFGVMLIITAPWFLHVGRLAANDVVYPLGMIIVMSLAAVWHNKAWSKWTLYISAVAGAGLVYIPGMIWLMLGVAFFERKNIFAQVKSHKKHIAFAVVLKLAILTPLIHSALATPGILKSVLAIPPMWPEPLTFVADYFRTWQYLFIGGYEDPVHNLARLPITSTLITIGFAVGIYLYAKHPKATRTKQLLWLWIAGSALIALSGISYALVVPIVFVMAIGGIGYLLHLWLKTFPRNPYARAFGIGLVTLVVGFAMAYNLRNYYVAWPQNDAVQQAFTRQL